MGNGRPTSRSASSGELGGGVKVGALVGRDGGTRKLEIRNGKVAGWGEERSSMTGFLLA